MDSKSSKYLKLATEIDSSEAWSKVTCRTSRTKAGSVGIRGRSALRRGQSVLRRGQSALRRGQSALRRGRSALRRGRSALRRGRRQF
uniref:Uncharacterized protein n=1 Tax=Gasterosteus aculeatus aculeatus TaxID=481459 RepID=A0AAQ4Q983_GASAC